MVDLNASGILYSSRKVVLIPQIHSSLCLATASPDSPHPQLVHLFLKLVSGPCTLCSLSHLSSIILHHYQGLFHPLQHLWQHFSVPNQPWHLLTPHAGLYTSQVLYLHFKHWHACSDHLWDIPSPSPCCLAPPFHVSGGLALPECSLLNYCPHSSQSILHLCSHPFCATYLRSTPRVLVMSLHSHPVHFCSGMFASQFCQLLSSPWAQCSAFYSVTVWVCQVVVQALGVSLMHCQPSLRCAHVFQQPLSLTIHAPMCLFSSPQSTQLNACLISPPHPQLLCILFRSPQSLPCPHSPPWACD